MTIGEFLTESKMLMLWDLYNATESGGPPAVGRKGAFSHNLKKTEKLEKFS